MIAQNVVHISYLGDVQGVRVSDEPRSVVIDVLYPDIDRDDDALKQLNGVEKNKAHGID